MPFYDYLEVGSCDFNTELVSNNNLKGISIEPIKYYYDNLINKEGCIKINIGISDKEGEEIIHYITPENIEKYEFHHDIKGSNSLYSNHKYVNLEIKKKGLNYDDIITKEQIQVKPLYSIYKEYDLKNIFHLKIDTEGHDKIIIHKFLNDIQTNDELPFLISFESNYLISTYDTIQIYSRLEAMGYDLLVKTIDNSFLQLNLTRLKNKTKFSEEFKGYYIKFYPENYDPNNLPHENTLEGAQKYCKEHNYTGITYQYGRYEVRTGKSIFPEYINKELKTIDRNVSSWVYL